MFLPVCVGELLGSFFITLFMLSLFLMQTVLYYAIWINLLYSLDDQVCKVFFQV